MKKIKTKSKKNGRAATDQLILLILPRVCISAPGNRRSCISRRSILLFNMPENRYRAPRKMPSTRLPERHGMLEGMLSARFNGSQDHACPGKDRRKNGQGGRKGFETVGAIGSRGREDDRGDGKSGSESRNSRRQAIIAAVKELLSLIAAGGWVAIVIILVLRLIGFLVCSPFGLFFSGENKHANVSPLAEVVQKVNAEFNAKIAQYQGRRIPRQPKWRPPTRAAPTTSERITG